MIRHSLTQTWNISEECSRIQPYQLKLSKKRFHRYHNLVPSGPDTSHAAPWTFATVSASRTIPGQATDELLTSRVPAKINFVSLSGPGNIFIISCPKGEYIESCQQITRAKTIPTFHILVHSNISTFRIRARNPRRTNTTEQSMYFS